MEDRSGYEVSPTAADALRRSIDSEVRAGWMRITPASHPNPAVPAPIVDQNDEMTQPLRKVRLPADRPDPVIFPTQALYARSQEDLLTATSINPTPTTVPPPIAALAGNIGERHVLIFVGLPLVGKRTIALRLKRYLRFFHGAKCKAFDIAKFTPPSSNGRNGAMSPMSPMDANAHAHDFFDTLRNFLEGSDDKPANGGGGAAMEVDNVANATATATAAARRASVNGVDPVDRNAKNVDSGRVAIIFSSDCMSTFYENWSGSSKERRRWILSSLATLSDSSKSKIRVKTIFIEVMLTKDGLVDNILEQKLDRDIREG